MSTNLVIGGITFNNVAGIKATDDQSNTVTFGTGATFDWADITEITIGANSVATTTDVQTYLTGTVFNFIVLKSALTTNNQFVSAYKSSKTGTGISLLVRWRAGALNSPSVGTNFDCKLNEGDKYWLITKK